MDRMAGKVILEVIDGAGVGRTFTFETRSICLIGRGKDCTVRLPNDDDHKLVSRHHCRLDIDPPTVRVCDLGSRNGTWVNGMRIPSPASSADEPAIAVAEVGQEIRDGDEVRIGKTSFRVTVLGPPRCCACGEQIIETARLGGPGGRSFFCAACLNAPGGTAPANGHAPRCARCGRDLAAGRVSDGVGAYVCAECQTDRPAIPAVRDPGRPPFVRGYRILKELGRGGMGAVYLAKRDTDGERVALKLLLPRVAADEHSTQRFLREAQVLKFLKHPNVVALHEFGTWEGAVYLTLDFCDGGNLLQLLRRRGGPLPIEEAWPLLRQLLEGMEYTHTVSLENVVRPDGTRGALCGLVHRDLKPSNVFLAGSPESPIVKIGDYGLAKAFDLAGLSGYTRSGSIVGTPQFLSRQQMINFKYARPEVDVWAVAAVFYWMITGSPPREFPQGSEWGRVVLEQPAVPIRQRLPDCPPRLAEVLDEALIDQPAIRFQSISALREALEKAF
jgi:eukaryotic-like serine/threonine-protein kinase